MKAALEDPKASFVSAKSIETFWPFDLHQAFSGPGRAGQAALRVAWLSLSKAPGHR